MKIRLKSLLVLVVGSLLISSISCEDVDLTGGDVGGEVLGIWEFNPGKGDMEYISITDDQIIFYFTDASEGCTTVAEYDIQSVDGEFYTITGVITDDVRALAISRRYDSIHVRDINDEGAAVKVYDQSQADPASFDTECFTPNLYGTWELTEEDFGTTWVKLEEDTITIAFYDEFLECFSIQTIKILEINGDVFTVETNDPESASGTGTEDVTIVLNSDDMLEVRRMENGEEISEIYFRSSLDIESLTPVCSADNIDFLKRVWQADTFENGELTSLLFMEVTDEVVNFYSYDGNPNNADENFCLELETFEIVSFSEGEAVLRYPGIPDETITATFKFEDGFLKVVVAGEEEAFFPMDDTPVDLFDNICTAAVASQN
jgi:hypothetical protein